MQPSRALTEIRDQDRRQYFLHTVNQKVAKKWKDPTTESVRKDFLSRIRSTISYWNSLLKIMSTNRPTPSPMRRMADPTAYHVLPSRASREGPGDATMPPPAPRSVVGNRAVLSEDDYVGAMEHIIERDFFPDLPRYFHYIHSGALIGGHFFFCRFHRNSCNPHAGPWLAG